MLENTSPAHLVILIVNAVFLVLVIWALVSTWTNRVLRVIPKLAWTALLVVIPYVGVLIWLGDCLVHRLWSRHPHQS